MTPTLKGWCAKYDFQCLCLPIPFLLIASITYLYDDSDYRCLFSFLVCERPIAINGRLTFFLLPKQTGHPLVRRDALVDFLNHLGTLDCFL